MSQMQTWLMLVLDVQELQQQLAASHKSQAAVSEDVQAKQAELSTAKDAVASMRSKLDRAHQDGAHLKSNNIQVTKVCWRCYSSVCPLSFATTLQGQIFACAHLSENAVANVCVKLVGMLRRECPDCNSASHIHWSLTVCQAT